MRKIGLLLLLAPFASLTWAGVAQAVRLDATAAGTATVGSQITYTVAVSPATQISGYDLTISWDPKELEFVSATPVFGSDFAVAPSPSAPQRSRVASVIPVPAGLSTTSLFSATFVVKPGFAQDGIADDFTARVDPIANGRGIAGPAGVILTIDNPRGVRFDGLVPEPEAAPFAAGLALLLLARGRQRLRTRGAVEEASCR
jgi:hypothetical protein